MDTKEASQRVFKLRGGLKDRWTDKKHVATVRFRKGVMAKLSRDRLVKKDTDVALVEIFLTEVLPWIDRFHGIFEVDEIGIWYWDGDDDIDEPLWRQGVIPWRSVKGLTIHHVS